VIGEAEAEGGGSVGDIVDLLGRLGQDHQGVD